MTTQSLGDIATATRIESIAKTMSVSSTLTTVAQNADRPSQALAVWACAAPPRRRPKKCLIRQIQQVEPADQLHPASRIM